MRQRREHTTCISQRKERDTEREHRITVLHIPSTKIMKVTEGLIVLLLALVSNVAARTRGGVRRRGLYVQNQQHAFASAFEAQTQTEFEPFRNLKAGSTDDDGTAVDDDSYGKVSKKGMMMSSKTHAAHAPSVSSSSSSKSDKAERTKAPSPSKAPTPTKAPKEEKASPAPKVERTKAPTPSKAPTATKAPKGEKASPAPKDSAAKAPQTAPSSSKKGEKGAGKTDKGKMDSSSEKGSGKTNSGRDKGKKDSGVVNEDGADDAPDGGSAFLGKFPSFMVSAAWIVPFACKMLTSVPCLYTQIHQRSRSAP